VPANLKVVDAPLVRRKDLFGESHLGHIVYGSAVFGRFLIFELVLHWLKLTHRLLLSVLIRIKPLFEDGR